MEKKKRSRVKIAVITIIILLVIGGLCAVGYYLYQRANSGLFFKKTTVNSYDAADKTSEEILRMLVKDYSAPKLTIREQEETALELTLAEMGYTVDETELLARIDECMKEQNANLLSSLFNGNEFTVSVPFLYDAEVFNSAVSSANFAKERVKSVDATLEFDAEKFEYYIQPEIYGTELDDADVRVMVKDLVDRMTAAADPQEDTILDIPDSFYFVPAVTQDNEKMNASMNLYNRFCKAKITLTFGEVTEKLDWNTIQNWMIFEDGEAIIDDEDVYIYVYDLAAKYDTLYYPREFTTHDGRTISYAGSDYGYQIDIDGEAQRIMADINENTEITREPVYAVKGYCRNGRDDLCGNYVEVNLSTQYLWFYKNDEIVTETSIVSGLPKDGRETVTGVFTIPYKKSPETLKGDTWSEEVTYWMPFYDGQGLHDAKWRGSFGGNIYQSNGSHGCVNLPTDQARVIYENMEERMPIFLYK